MTSNLSSTSRLLQLAKLIHESVAKLEDTLSAKGFPSPTFDEDAPQRFPRDTVDAISRFKIASLVPIGGRTTFADIAEQTGLEEHAIRRLLRHAMAMRVFKEPEPGVMVDAFEKWPGSSEPNHTGVSLANNTEDSIYQVLDKNPEKGPSSLGPIKMVDVGGCAGHHSLELARRFPNLSVIVQDTDKMFEGVKIPAELEGRFEFMAYDLFAPQTIQADVYFFRWIFHNWSDKYSVLIIKALIPALKPGAKIILNESCMPEPGEIAHWREKDLRSFDMSMGASFNSYERSLDEWKALLSEADPRFTFQKVSGAKDSALSIIEFIWSDGKN
ncbi:hypothetical protein ABKA04_004039 [Annulohypoxylon sp. FPYF3050]